MHRLPARSAALALAALALLAGLTGCGSSTSDAAGPGASSGGRGSGTVTVFAAASLTESFGTLGRQFEAAHPGASVRFSFAASSTLAQQIVNGAPADVFASASRKNMDQVVAAGEAADPTPFARNVLEIAVPPDNPAKITTLADLARPGVKVAVCQPQVPCGGVAQTVLGKAKLTVHPVTLGQDVKAVLTAVRTGEVDAGLVYVTDVRAAGGKVAGIEIAKEANASTAYPIAVTTHSRNPGTARAFVDFVLSGAGRATLAAAGFTPP
jgi:molybdate transport system substrate-binding protein